MGNLISFISGVIAPLFLVFSPITSYADQIYSIHKSKSSAGFSLDIPLIMLCASMLRIFYFPGAQFDTALLIQSFIMMIMQTLLLKVALDNRPGPASKGGDAATPFAGHRDGAFVRPFNFWKWRSPKPYWQFLLYLFITLTAFELILTPTPWFYSKYSKFIGYLGLSIEATLPLPQIYSNYKSRSCKGFRVSVLANWLGGDAMKMFWFFTATTEITWAFKLCGIFQMCCDCFLGFQYYMYGDGDGRNVKGHGEHEMSSLNSFANGSHIARARTPMGEKSARLGD
ncbi:hypothetical protein HYFRA_00008879 [Hymenoscyphus fraxineus]|uniref:PQ loop repeat protein n=1 Tax=Hymenoscyphus fraxineus TaxID=746836 RepID=A0A9N9L0N5_9HELO|nr:hypothetical protein HYFRA_00008879 [Hymenoscyphus fraxineus]